MRLDCGCPDQFPEWDGRDVMLSGRLVHRQSLASFFFMPLSFDLYRQRQHEEIQQLGLAETWPGFILTRTGMLGGHMLALLDDGQSPSRRVSRLEAPFEVSALLHHGGIGTISTSIRALQMRLFDQGRLPKEQYLAYLTCPRCAESRGGEKILLLRRWLPSLRLTERLNRHQ